ncbi:GGDEF domain-containing protein [Rheinheimera sp. YQF-2]|uniref:diguanylate cyclase n=1 Tax=Rheinheimera lutimaris TaxID=2740584 RepID=A0A7Y5APD3_9GAMM|nr:GGDEF domain-containing protein [Rheinheimera lutimaris]NRQ41615.1 GGDEF domain-containing protein [Rheinheimera lutimaris]
MPDIDLSVLDLTTLIILTLVVNLLVSAYMALLARLQPQQTAFRHWALSCVIFVLASALAAGRLYQVPALLSVLLAHALLALPPVLIGTGLLRFIHGPQYRLPRTALILCAAGYLLLLSAGYTVLHSAAVLNAAAITAGCVWCIVLLQAVKKPLFVSRLLQLVLALHALTMLAEIYLYLNHWHSVLPPQASALMQLMLLSHLLLTTVAAVLLPLLFFISREQLLRQQADLDELTLLPNRRHFLRESSAYLMRNNSQAPVVVMMLDLDYFKAINDTHGHATGDAALKQVAGILMAELRKTDFIGRIGGEEFAIVMPDTTADDARAIGERLRHQVEQQARTVEGKAVNLTISIGATYSQSERVTDFQTLLKRADDALYEAKRSGRNNFIFHLAQ